MRPPIALLCLLCLPAAVARGTEDTRPQLLNSPRLAAPDAVSTHPASGSATYRYRIEVPPGTGGLAPELELVNSNATRNTEYGYGWHLPIGRIERSTRFGAPDYLDPATPVGLDPATGAEHPRHRFELDGELLIRDPSTPERFHRRLSDGSRILYLRSPSGGAEDGYWEVTRRDGTRYRYGSRPSGQSTLGRGPLGSGRETFRWSLDEVIDARGNAYRIDYAADIQTLEGDEYALYVYPHEILYSYHYETPGASGELAAAETDLVTRRIAFEWQGRGDPGIAYDPNDLDAWTADRPTSYRAGFKVQRRKRLAAIRIEETGGTPIRRYELEYAPKIVHGTDAGGAYDFHGDVFRPNSELASIQRYGSDGSAHPSRTTFDYTVADNDFAAPVSVAGSGGPIRVTHSMYAVGDTPVGDGLYDFDGDGFLDISPLELGGGNGASPVGFGQRPSPYARDYDAVWHEPFRHLYRDAFDWNDPPGFEDFGLRADMIDLDGDGRVDRVEYRDCGGSSPSPDFCWLHNNGAGFDPAVPWAEIDGLTSLGWTARVVYVGDEELATTQGLIDINGDGLPDHTIETLVFLNNGSGFDPPSIWSGMSGSLMKATTRSLPSESHVDINGDGLPDRHRFGLCLGGGNTYFNLGDRFQRDRGHGHEAYEGDCATPVTATPASPETGLFGGTYSTLVDLNGDGVVDLVTANGWGPLQPFDAGGPHWNVYYGLGDGRFLFDTAPSRAEQSPVDGIFGIDGFSGHHWSIPGFRIPELVETGEADVPPPTDVTSAYWIRYTASAGPPAQQWNGSVSDLIDLTGDGLPDYLDRGDGGPWRLWANTAASGLLRSVSNELGGTVEIRHLPQPHAARQSAAPAGLSAPDSPGPEALEGTGIVPRAIAGRWVVASIEHRDGRSGNFEIDRASTFRYAEPRFDAVLRETRGHRLVEETDALGGRTRSLFHQTRALSGRLEASEIVGLPGTLLESRKTTWQALPVASMGPAGPAGGTVPGAWHVVPAAERIRHHAPQAPEAFVERGIARTHDPVTGSVRSEIETGHGIRRTTVISGEDNWERWIVGFPSALAVTLYEGSGERDGPRTELHYDGAGFGVPPVRGLVTTRRTLYDGGHDDGHYREERWTWDRYGNQTAWFDGDAVASARPVPTRSTTWESAWQTFPETITNGVGDTTQYTFDRRFGRVSTVLDPAGRLRCHERDAFGRLAWIGRRASPVSGPRYCDERLAGFVYGALGDPEAQHVLRATFPHPGQRALWSLRSIDGLGRTYRELRHAGGTHERGDVDYFVSLFGWDRRGHEACATLPFRASLEAAVGTCRTHPQRRDLHSDVLGRPLALERADGQATHSELTYRYSVDDLDADGQPDLVTEITTHADVSRVVRQAKDAWGWVVATTADPHGERHRLDFRRDALRRIVGIDEYSDHVLLGSTAIDYYPSGERRRLRPPGSAPGWHYAYDDGGNLSALTSRALATTRFEYDAAGRLVARDAAPLVDPSGCCFGAGDARFRYEHGRLVHTSSPAIDASYEYGADGELRHELRTIHDGLELTFGASHLYDRLGRPMLSLLPGGLWVARHHDGGLPSRIEQLADDAGTIVEGLAYHASGALSRIVYPRFGAGALTASWEYDRGSHRMAAARVEASDGSVLLDHVYEYDLAGNLRSIDDGLLDGLSRTFAYDSLFRLRSTTATGRHAGLFDALASGFGRTFAYGPGGNLVKKGPLSLAYGDSASSTSGPHAAIGTLDANGNGEWVGSIDYDPNGAVVAIARDAGAERFVLDRDGNGRVTTTCPGTSCQPLGPDDTHHRRDAAGRRVRILRGSSLDRISPFPWLDVDLVKGRHEIHHVVGGRRVATVVRQGIPTIASPNGVHLSTRQLHVDATGSNVLVTDSAGYVARSAVLDAYGELLGTPEGEADIGVPLFAGREHDAATGLIDFGARSYDPATGRFLSPDPELEGPIDPRIPVTMAELAFGLAGAQALSREQVGHPSLTTLYTGSPIPSRAGPGHQRLAGERPGALLPGITFARLRADPTQIDPLAYVANRPTVFTDVGGHAIGGVAGTLFGGLIGGLGGAGFELGRGMARQLTHGDGDISFATLGRGFRDGFVGGAVTGLLVGAALDPTTALVVAAGTWHGWIAAGMVVGTVEGGGSAADCGCTITITDLPSAWTALQ